MKIKFLFIYCQQNSMKRNNYT